MTPASTNRKVAAFDFDGTLAEGDAVLPFCASVAGRLRGVVALLRESRLIVEVARGRGDRDTLKKSFVRRMLSGHAIEELEVKGRVFAESRLPKLFPSVMQRVAWHRHNGHELVIVSASLDVYLQPMKELLDFDSALCTRLERSGDVFTGELDGRNVRAQEKATRLSAHIGDDETELWAYGNSKDDFAMLEMADHPFFVEKSGEFGPWTPPVPTRGPNS